MGQPISTLLERVATGATRRVADLPGAACAHLLARLAHTHPGPLLTLAPDGERAARLFRDLSFFCAQSGLTPPLYFPSWENLPHEFASPLPEVAGQRMAVLLACREQPAPLVVAPVAAVAHRLPPLEAVTGYALRLAPGTEFDPQRLPERLAVMGYSAAAQVTQPGTYALRRDILDVFPPHLPDPCRVTWFGDEVEAVRAFDPVSQRSTSPLEAVTLPPVTELPADPLLVERAQQRVREIAAARDLDAAIVTLETGRLDRTPRTDGIEAWAPFFFDAPMTALTDHLPEGARVALVEAESVRATARGTRRRAEEAMADEAARGTIVPEVEALFVDLAALVGERPALELEPATPLPEGAPPGPWRTVEHAGLGPLETGAGPGGFAGRFDTLRALAAAGPVTVVCPERGRADAFGGILREHALPFTPPEVAARGPGIRVAVGALSAGFAAEGEGVFLTEAEVFGRQTAAPPPPRSRLTRFLSGFSDLKAGDHVVHLHHGIGIYRGLNRLATAGVEADFLELEYLGGDRVYVPMDRLDLVQKYAGSEESPPKLDRMGGKTWEKTRSRVRRELTTLARDLVELAAAREVARGHAFAPEGAAGIEFAASFPYTETPDQLRAIEEVRADMERPRPMDRLVCGDVGYGKTEVALRAAFKAMLDGRQVVLLAPTTLLAQQHYRTCVKRFGPYPFRIAQLSRFAGARDQKQVLAGLADGTVDLVVATHRLLTREVAFKRLGLLVVDEEQRFGVAHKERIKQWKTSIDVLTLTATPIPRTLQLSLIGVRDLSIIDTPPPDRRAIRTRVARFDPILITEAVERELERGGQVFFIHNRVQDIGGMASYLQRLVPKARIAVAHGQMPERQLERVMTGFIEGEKDLLLSTSIVESGLDIPRANTIIIHRADRFGLAELYQLRGRVGRSGIQAHAFLLGPEEGWSGEAKERLMAIQAFTDLGSGFRIAARDLEIRGAGSLLGHRQSGQIAAVGIDAYMQLIKEAMAEIRGEALEPEFETEIKLGGQAAIPDAYIADGGVRLAIYKRISGLDTEEQVAALEAELGDRFGPAPPQVEALLGQARLHLLARRLRVSRLEHAGRGRYEVAFAPDHTLSEVGLRMLLTEYGPKVHFTAEHAFSVQLDKAPHEGGSGALAALLENL